MAKALPNLTGETFGAWKVIRLGSTVGEKFKMWCCRCSCGVTRSVYGPSLVSGKSRDCGHGRNEVTTQRNKSAKKITFERFWEYVNKQGPTPSKRATSVHPNIKGTRCWVWTNAITNDGYGRMSVHTDGKTKRFAAHRLAWFLITGAWPNPCALHKCDNRACVRKSHLFEGTTQDNTADMMAKRRVQ